MQHWLIYSWPEHGCICNEYWLPQCQRCFCMSNLCRDILGHERCPCQIYIQARGSMLGALKGYEFQRHLSSKISMLPLSDYWPRSKQRDMPILSEWILADWLQNTLEQYHHPPHDVIGTKMVARWRKGRGVVIAHLWLAATMQMPVRKNKISCLLNTKPGHRWNFGVRNSKRRAKSPIKIAATTRLEQLDRKAIFLPREV